MNQNDSLSHMAWLRSLIIIFILTGILIVIANKLITPSEVTLKAEIIKKIDLKHIDEMVISSEPPKLIYADKNKVVFDASGVFVYDLKKKKIIKTFDTTALRQGEQCSSMVTKDGKQLIINYSNHYVFTKAYQYSFENDSFLELTKEEWDEYCELSYQCDFPPTYHIQNEEPSGGYIARISEKEYLYLTFSKWKVETLQLVHVNGKKHTIYKIFKT